MTIEEKLRVIDELRARGAREIQVEDIKVVFDGPASAPRDEDADEKALSRTPTRKERTFEERLFGTET